MRNWCRTRVCSPHQAGQARPTFLPHRWGRLLPIVLQDALTEREGNVGPGDRKFQFPGTKVCQTHACPPDRKAGPWSHSVLPSCWTTPNQCFPLSGPLRRLHTGGGFVCVLAWAGNSRGIEENNAKIWASLSPAIPFSVPLHSKYCIQDTATEMPCTLCGWFHTFTLSDKCHVHNLSSIYTHHCLH